MKLLKWIRRQLDRITWFYQLRCFLFNRYSTVKPRYLPHTWIDKCDQIPHVMFELLSKFLERECDLQKDYTLGSRNIVLWHGKDAHTIEINGELEYVMDVMINLYKWWHNEYILFWQDKHPIQQKLDNEIAKWRPERYLIPIPNTDLLRYKHEFASDEAKIKYGEAMRKQIQFDREMNNKLNYNMKLLVDVKDYMWT